MQAEEIEALVRKMTEPLLAGSELKLLAVEYVKEEDYYLRIYIDKPGGVEIEDCQMLSEKLTALLEANDPLSENYILEVSSPGVDRPLKTDEDFRAAYGKKVDLIFNESWQGKTALVGILTGHDFDAVSIRQIVRGRAAKTPTLISRSTLAVIRPHLDF